MQLRMIELHALSDNKRILIDLAEIESIVEQKSEAGRYDNHGVWKVHAVGTEINMRSGDKGAVAEQYDTVVGAIIALLKEDE